MSYGKKEMKHWYLAAVEIQFIIMEPTDTTPAVYSERKVNVLITPDRKNLGSIDIDDVRNLALLRLRDDYNIPPERVANLVILNLMYMGLMSEEQYFRKRSQPST